MHLKINHSHFFKSSSLKKVDFIHLFQLFTSLSSKIYLHNKSIKLTDRKFLFIWRANGQISKLFPLGAEMKKYKIFSLFLLPIIISFILVVFVTTLIAIPVSGEDWGNGEPKEVDIVTDPTDYLFQLSNMRPGDSVSKSLTLTNTGSRNLSYFTEIEYKSGLREFIESLQLKIDDTRGDNLYSGTLLNLNTESFAMRYLPVMAEDLLEFTITFPDTGEVQNHLQNKTVIFELSLKAEEHNNRDLGFKKITGGGTIEHNKSGKNNGKSYGFNVMPKEDGLSVILQYTDYNNQIFKSIHVNEYAYNVNPIMNNKVVVGIEFDVIGEIDKEVVKLHVKMVDYGEPGKDYKFFLEVIDGPEGIKNYKSGDENVTGGIIQIHR
jgi:hypothetical protein